MNCRKVSSLLSAYIDRELTGAEMLEVRAHVELCRSCHGEHESLAQTKRLLSTLSLQTPRAELEQLLVVRAEALPNPGLLARVLPPEWSDAMLFRWEGVGNLGSPRLRPLAATALLSLAGLCLATASLSGPHDEAPMELPQHAFTVYINSNEAMPHLPVAPTISDFTRRPDAPNVTEVSTASEPVNGTMWGTLPAPGYTPVGDRADWGQNDLILSPVGYRAPDPYRAPAHSLSMMLVSSRPQ